MDYKWGDTVMVLCQLYNGEYYDITGQYRGLCHRGKHKGAALVSLMGAPDNFHIPAERLFDVEQYFKLYHAGQKLPDGACGRLITDSPIESEGARGNLLTQMITVPKAEGKARGVVGEDDKKDG